MDDLIAFKALESFADQAVRMVGEWDRDVRRAHHRRRHRLVHLSASSAANGWGGYRNI